MSGTVRGRRARAGVTLIESTMSIAVLAIGLVTSVSVVTSSMDLDRTNRETGAAITEARRIIEEVRAEPVDRLIALYDANQANDPSGVGTAPGNRILLTTLGKQAVGAAPACEILLPIDDTGSIRENLTIPELGLPADLNADGVVDGADHTADALIVPIAVRVTWVGARGARQLMLRSARCR